MKLSDPICSLRLVGPTYAKRLEKLGIFTIEDMLFHFPFRYDDFSLISPINRVQAGETITITGKVEKIENSYTKSGKKIQTAVISDNTGKIEAVWFNQPFLIKTIKTGETYNFSGNCSWFGRTKVLLSPEYELLTPTSPDRYHTYQPPNAHENTQITNQTFDRYDTCQTIHTGRLVPVYNETYGVSSKWFRSRIKTVLEIFGSQVEEFLPQEILLRENLIAESNAVKEIHFPQNANSVQSAKKRLSFDELFLIQLAGLIRKKDWQLAGSAPIIKNDEQKIFEFLKKLSFELTEAQRRCIKEILNDIGQKTPMNRLLEGDVGSGKTVVAATAAYATFLSGYQTLFMAPTEILANQHYSTLQALLTPLGVPVELITGNRKSADSKQLTADSNKQSARIIIGTHALLYQDFSTEKVGLVIVDEQHRFGVEQRALLSQKGNFPHFLTMTATPIPRTIALTLFGDLDLSVIDEMPKGRIPVKTWVVPKEKRAKGYEWIRSKIKDTPEQAFIICPLIEESESLTDVKAVTKEFETLSKKIFPDLRLGLLHGRIKSKEKEKILTDFKEGKLDILVSTPVVEVGIDVPNATIMVIEAADRFGLAQLHQLRGRVGRSDMQSYCFLFTESQNSPVIERLKYMEKTGIGIELAEADLKLRGPGEIYGTKQHGFPDLKIASFSDLNLIQKTRFYAQSATILSEPLKKKLEKYRIGNVNN